MYMRVRLSLQNLNTFATAAEVASFQGAAGILHVTASAISHQIRALERALGYPLFERLDKRVRLTTRGQQLYQEIREPLRQLHQASHNALRGSDDTTLALSVAPVFATRWLLPRLSDFRVRHPELSLSIIAAVDLVDFRADPFDAAIRVGAGRWPDAVSKRLFDRQIVAVCHPGLLARNGGRFAADQLIEQVLVHNSSMQDLWPAWFASAGIVPTGPLPGTQVQSVSQVLEVIQVGEAIGLVDARFVGAELNDGRLALACDHVLADDEGYFLTYPAPLSDRTALQLFEQWLLAQVALDAMPSGES